MLTSTIVSDVSSRTPHSRSPRARATSSEVRTQSFCQSTRTIRLALGSMYSAYFWAARTVSPLYAAISECGTVPTPLPPHQDAWASVETPIAPETCAA